MSPLPLKPPSHLPPHSTPLGHHRAPGWAPCIIRQLPTGCLFYIRYCICFHAALNSCRTLLTQLCLQLCCSCLSLHCCPANRFISIIFLDSTCMWWSEVGDRRKVQREGTHVYLWLIHVGIWKKSTQYCKAIILQLNDPSPRVMEIKTKISKWDLIKLKNFCTSRELWTRWKDNPQNGRK